MYGNPQDFDIPRRVPDPCRAFCDRVGILSSPGAGCTTSGRCCQKWRFSPDGPIGNPPPNPRDGRYPANRALTLGLAGAPLLPGFGRSGDFAHSKSRRNRFHVIAPNFVTLTFWMALYSYRLLGRRYILASP